MEKRIILSVGDEVLPGDEMFIAGGWYSLNKTTSTDRFVAKGETIARLVKIDDSKYRFLEDFDTVQENDEFYSVANNSWVCADFSIGSQVREWSPTRLYRRKVVNAIGIYSTNTNNFNTVLPVYKVKPTPWTDGQDGWVYYDGRPAFLVNASLNVDLQEVVNALNQKGVVEYD